MNFNSKHCLMFLSIFMVMNNLITARITIRTCASKLELDTCFLESVVTENGVEKMAEYYGTCKSDEVCAPAGGVYKCVSRKYPLKLNKACVVNGECQSGLCKDKKCSELNVGEVCTSDKQCGRGFYCKYTNDDNRVCAEYASEGEDCGGGIECKPYLACGTSKCVKKFSLENGQETITNLACKSGVSAYFGNKHICANLTVVDECSTENSCILQYNHNGETYSNDRYCEYTSDGKYTCSYQEGSPEMLKYIELYTEKFNELKEEDLEEIENYNTLDSEDILEAYVVYKNSPELNGAEQCVVDAYISEESQSSQRIISLKKILLIGLIALLI